MSVEFKMSRWGRNKKSRLHEKITRAALNRIDAPHLPMRVHTGKNGYWGETSASRAYYPYKKFRKFLMKRIGKPIDKVFSEFLIEAKKFNHNENLEELFYSHIFYRENKMRWGKAVGFYVSNGILNYKNDYKEDTDTVPKNLIEYNKEHWDGKAFDIFEPLNNVGPNLIGKFWVEVKGQYMLLPVYAVYSRKWGYSKGECEEYSIVRYTVKSRNSNCDYLKEFTECCILGKGCGHTIYKTYPFWDGTLKREPCNFLYIVRISDIENYKKEKFKEVV